MAEIKEVALQLAVMHRLTEQQAEALILVAKSYVVVQSLAKLADCGVEFHRLMAMAQAFAKTG